MAATAKKKAASRRAASVTTRSARAVQRAPGGPLYQVIKEPTHLNQVLHPIGAKVVYYGEPGSTLVALNDEAKARKIAVRDIRNNPDLSVDEKKAALRELSDEWNGVLAPDGFAESEANLDDDAAPEKEGSGSGSDDDKPDKPDETKQ